MPQSVINETAQSRNRETSLNGHNSGNAELQAISARIDKSLYVNLKVYSVTHFKKMNDLIEDALREYLRKSA